MNFLGLGATFVALVAAVFAIVGVSGTCKGWASVYDTTGAQVGDYGTTGVTVCFVGICGCGTYGTSAGSAFNTFAVNGARTALAFDIFAMLVLIGATAVFAAVSFGVMGGLKLLGVALAVCGAVFTLIAWAVYVGTLNTAISGTSSTFTLEYAWILTLIAFVLSIIAAAMGFFIPAEAADAK